MREDIPAKAIAACIALAGFVVAILAGLAVENPADSVLSRALLAMLVCWVLGTILAGAATKCVNRSIEISAMRATQAAELARRRVKEMPEREKAASDGGLAQPGV